MILYCEIYECDIKIYFLQDDFCFIGLIAEIFFPSILSDINLNLIQIYSYKNFYKIFIILSNRGLGIGDWGLGIGDWGLGPIPNPQSPKKY